MCFSLPNVTNTSKHFKRRNKFEKYETLFTSMGMHVKCSRIYQVRISFDRHPTRYYMEVPILCKTLGTYNIAILTCIWVDIQLQPFPWLVNQTHHKIPCFPSHLYPSYTHLKKRKMKKEKLSLLKANLNGLTHKFCFALLKLFFNWREK